MSAILVMWVLLSGLVVLICGQVRNPPMGGVSFVENYVGPCLAVNHTPGTFVGFIVVNDTRV